MPGIWRSFAVLERCASRCFVPRFFFSGEKCLKCLITSFSMKFVAKSEQGSCGVK